MISEFWLLIRHYSSHLPEKKGLCGFIISTLSRLTYLLLHRLFLTTSHPYNFLLLSLFLTTSLLIPFYFSPYYFLLSSLLLTTSLLTPYHFPLTPFYFSPYSLLLPSLLLLSLLLPSLLLPHFFFKPIHQPLQLLGDG